MEENLSYDIQKIKQSLLNFKNDNFKENSLKFFETLGYKSTKDISFISTPESFYCQLSQEGKAFDKNKVLFYRWKKCVGLFHYTAEELNNMLQHHHLMLCEDYNQSYLFLAIELNGFFYKENELKIISQEINKCSAIPIIILYKYFDKIALSITKRRRNRLNSDKDVIEDSLIRVKSYKNATDMDAKLFADLSIYKILQTAKLVAQGVKERDTLKEKYVNNSDYYIDVSEIEKCLMEESKFDDYDFEEEEQEYLKGDKQTLNDTIKWYLQKIGNYKLLTGEQEVKLAMHIINDGKITNEQEKEIILSNLRLVVSIAKKYAWRGMEFEDIIQEGNIGLMKAVEHFDYTKGCKFSTYATWWIKQSIRRAIDDKSRLIRLPVYMIEKLNKLKNITRRLTQEYLIKPTEKELAAEIGISISKLRDLVMIAQEPLSLEAPISVEEDLMLGDFIEDQASDAPIKAVVSALLKEDIAEVFCSLSPKERDVLILRFGIYNDKERTLEETGQLFGVTRERIRQIEAKAIDKLRNSYRKKNLIGYLD